MFFYAGAALAQPIWDSLYESQEREIGERIVMSTGLGMTESGPFGIFVTNPHVRAGDLGVPTPGLELKLVDMDGKTEVRYRGPNITPGYWRAPQETAEAFDEEGFFKTGDAVKWIDETDVHLGLKFDGRIAEDFKLATGTFVSVGPLRGKIIAAGAPYVQDVVLTGLNMKEVGAMVFPTPAVRQLAGLPAEAPLADVLSSAPVLAHFQSLVNDLARSATGSANRIASTTVAQWATSPRPIWASKRPVKPSSVPACQPPTSARSSPATWHPATLTSSSCHVTLACMQVSRSMCQPRWHNAFAAPVLNCSARLLNKFRAA